LVEAKDGLDPAAARSKAHGLTVGDLADRFITVHAKTKKKPSSRVADERNLRLHIRPALGRKLVTEVARADIQKLHHDMRETPGAANRCLALLSTMFNLAEKWGLRTDATNPVRHVERYPEKKMERFLSAEELARLGVVLAETERTSSESPMAVAAIRLLIFTGARKGEILGLRWDEINTEDATARLADSKTGAKTLFLSAPALEVISNLPRVEGNPYVMAGKKPGAQFVNVDTPWFRIRARAGLDDVRIHDLRHSFASMAAADGLSLPTIGALLGHTQAATTQRYAHLAADPLKQASDLIGRRMAAAMRGEAGGHVIALERK
jgi:integrase